MYDLVCIGASWGGLTALGRVLADLPAELDIPIAIAQHRHPDSQEGTLAELLQAQTNRVVLDVEDKMAIEPRHVYIAPPNYHLLVERGSFALSVDERSPPAAVRRAGPAHRAARSPVAAPGRANTRSYDAYRCATT